MPRAPARFTQADVTRAVKGAEQAGLRVTAIETKPASRNFSDIVESANAE